MNLTVCTENLELASAGKRLMLLQMKKAINDLAILFHRTISFPIKLPLEKNKKLKYLCVCCPLTLFMGKLVIEYVK